MLKPCPECGNDLSTEATSCPHCGRPLRPVAAASPPPGKSDLLAGLLAVLLGPVGLWYKGRWAEGIAWLAGGLLLFLATGAGIGSIGSILLWIGLVIRTFVAVPQL